jgi:hypothetical protein
VHVKHAVIALVLGLVLLGFAWVKRLSDCRLPPKMRAFFSELANDKARELGWIV